MTRDTLRRAMLDSLRMNRSVVLVMLAYVGVAYLVGQWVGFEVYLRIYSRTMLALMAVSFWIVLLPVILLQLYRHRPSRPARFLWRYFVDDLRIVERGLVALPCLVLFPAFTSAMTSVKMAIPLIHPYSLDPLFARLDGLIHGGQAWELIHPLVAFPVVTFALNVAYNMWFFVMWVCFAMATVMTDRPELRERYLLSFFGCWILLGSVAAVAFSSVGPSFYGLVYATDPYAPLMDYLRSVDETYSLWALATQDMLWQSHISGSAGLGSGISAMPSMHLAIATVNALLLARLSRTAGILGWLYVAVILVGSVHLGWHYAIDGYVSILAVIAIWRAAGWWVARGTRVVRLAQPQAAATPTY